MKMYQFMLALAVISLAGTSLGAQFSETTGPKTLVAGGNYQWAVVVDFGSTAHAEDFTITVDTNDVGFIVELVDCASSARAPGYIEWLDANVSWDGSTAPAGSYTLGFDASTPRQPVISGAVTPYYTTTALEGKHKFFFRVFAAPSNSNNITLTLDNGTSSATVSGTPSFPQPSYNPSNGSPAPITGTSSEAYVRHDVQQAYGIVEFNSATDAIKFNFPDTQFPNPAQAIDVGLLVTMDAVATDVEFDFHLLAEDGGTVPSHTMTASGNSTNPSAHVTTYTTGSYTGNEDFRLVLRGGTNFAGPITLNFWITWSHSIVLPAVPNGDPARAVEPPITISPSSTTIPASPQILVGDGGSNNANAYQWTIEGTVPNGVTLTQIGPLNYEKEAELAFTGATPVGATVTIRATSAVGEWREETYDLGALTLTVSDPVADELPDGIVGSSYVGVTIQAVNGQTPYSWDDLGTLPAGLSIDSASGEISGIPDPGTEGIHNVDIQVTDAAMDTDLEDYTIEISAAGSMTITTTNNLPSGTESFSYGPVEIEVSPPAANYSWSATGLPSGLSINSTTGVITGTLGTGTAGSHAVTITVADIAGTDSVTLGMTVDNPPPPSASGGGGGGGCTTTQSGAPWLVLMALLGAVAAGSFFRRGIRVRAGEARS